MFGRFPQLARPCRVSALSSRPSYGVDDRRGSPKASRWRVCTNVLDVEPAHDEGRIYLALSLVETSASAKAVAELRRTGLAGTPDVKAMLARALATAGRPDDARGIVADLVAGYPAGYIPRFWIAAALVALGQFEDALAQLEAASRDPDDSYAGINVAPLFDAIRWQPRFQALVTGVGLWPGDPGQ